MKADGLTQITPEFPIARGHLPGFVSRTSRSSAERPHATGPGIGEATFSRPVARQILAPAHHPTPEQRRAARQLVRAVRQDMRVAIQRFMGRGEGGAGDWQALTDAARSALDELRSGLAGLFPSPGAVSPQPAPPAAPPGRQTPEPVALDPPVAQPVTPSESPLDAPRRQPILDATA